MLKKKKQKDFDKLLKVTLTGKVTKTCYNLTKIFKRYKKTNRTNRTNLPQHCVHHVYFQVYSLLPLLFRQAPNQ